jgi:hypothetical protein
MLIPIAVGILGLMLGGRTKPISRHSKLVMLGPNTGYQYKTEDLPDSGIIVVHAPDGTSVTFDRDFESKRLRFKCAKGNPGTVDLIRKDFEPVQLQAVPKPKTA